MYASKSRKIIFVCMTGDKIVYEIVKVFITRIAVEIGFSAMVDLLDVSI